jgi:FKBP-type peptidyl-prolyl cis-trans isomerase
MKTFIFPKIFFVFLAVFAFCGKISAQNEAILVTPLGMRYIHHIKTGGKKAELNDIMKIQFRVFGMTKAGKDTLLADTWAHGTKPLPAEVDKMPFKDVYTVVSQGDSVTVLVPIDGTPGTEFAKLGSDIRYQLKIFDVMKRSEYEAEMRAVMEKKRAEEALLQQQQREKMKTSPLGLKQDSLIQKYLSDNKLTGVKHESGMYIVFDSKGEGAKVQKGEEISVHYSGFLPDGTKFDSSRDRNQPFTVKIGLGMVIQGWDIGLLEFNKGGKGKLVIPSYLAYGERGAGGSIPPNSILIFDVEVLN